MSRRTIALLFIALTVLGVGGRVSGVGKTSTAASTSDPRLPTPAAIAAHIHFLASDVLEGRETGMRGYEVAAEYVRAQFEAIGLKPLHDDWFQRFALRAAALDEEHSSLAINGQTLVIRKDFLLRPDFARDNVSIDAPLVV